ncbi:venom allergen 5-like isoform X2 [Cimex lectularius]|uniref:SCP domain-containing protein n=1 Tax=Cimex lectularius TaxID=79782 RepID=A0A8I6TH78_CIMLE|nr:venom allergen 5-like isoform X2 [Cimex lectularius]
MSKQVAKITIFLLGAIISNVVYGKTDDELCDMCLNDDLERDQHILCMFPYPEPAEQPGCRNVDMSITDDAFRAKILDWHNNYRNKFAEGSWPGQEGKNFPKAANMMLFHYDYQLERLARRHVQNCYSDHEKCRLVERFQYGQNLGYQSCSNPQCVPNDTSTTWNNWVDEMKDYDPRDVEKLGTYPSSSQVFHFVAATWANTRLLGCAQGRAEVGGNINFQISVACNYGPMGVWMGEPMYLQGKPCSMCPNGTACSFDINYPNLCGGVLKTDFPFMDPTAGKEPLTNMGHDEEIEFHIPTKSVCGTVCLCVILKILLTICLILALDLRI